MLKLLDVNTYSRGETRIEITRRADQRFWLKVNNGEPTPISVRELADLIYDWTLMLKDAGYPPQPYYR